MFGKAGTRTLEQKLAALAHAQSLIKSFPLPCILAFTDGSCLGNPGNGAAAARLEYCSSSSSDNKADEAATTTEKKIYQEVEYVGDNTTNNQCELQAIGLALRMLTLDDDDDEKEKEKQRRHYRRLKEEKWKTAPCYILTDSQYCLQVLGHKNPVSANANWVDKVRQQMSLATQPLHFYKVCGHVGLWGNDIVDKLAQRCARTKINKRFKAFDKRETVVVRDDNNDDPDDDGDREPPKKRKLL